jgi:hypothetical protein
VQLLGRGEGERAEEDLIDDAEDRGRGGDDERDREPDADGVRRRASQGSQGEPKFTQQAAPR